MAKILRGRRTRSTIARSKPVRHSRARDVDLWFLRVAQGKPVKRIEARLKKTMPKPKSH